MGYKPAAAALIVVLALLAPRLATAGDYIAEAVQVLQHASVYVAPGTEGTDHDTAARLQSRLSSNDDIVLVMLPASARTELGADTFTIVSRLSEELGNRKIVGLAIGNTVIGYAQTLPAGIASDQMGRAKSVSNDPVTALVTFSQNVHLWQKEHPQLTSTPTPKPTSTPVPTPSPEEVERARKITNTRIGGSALLLLVIVFGVSCIKIVRNMLKRRED